MTAAYNYFHVTNFFWMFGEGCYLHTAIVLTYSTDRLRKWMFICIGWGARPGPLLPQPGSPLLARIWSAGWGEGAERPGPGQGGGVSTTRGCGGSRSTLKEAC